MESHGQDEGFASAIGFDYDKEKGARNQAALQKAKMGGPVFGRLSPSPKQHRPRRVLTPEEARADVRSVDTLEADCHCCTGYGHGGCNIDESMSPINKTQKRNLRRSKSKATRKHVSIAVLDVAQIVNYVMWTEQLLEVGVQVMLLMMMIASGVANCVTTEPLGRDDTRLEVGQHPSLAGEDPTELPVSSGAGYLATSTKTKTQIDAAKGTGSWLPGVPGCILKCFTGSAGSQK